MAGHVGDRSRSLDGRLADEGQKNLGILAVSAEQRAMDNLGCACWSLCANRAPGVSCFLEHQGNGQEQLTRKRRREGGAQVNVGPSDDRDLVAPRFLK